MSAVPSLNIPIAVNTSRMETDLREAEAKLKRSAARMNRIRAATTPAVGALGGGAFGSVLGGVAAAGGGSVAALGLAAAVPIYGLSRAMTAIKESATGAMEALQKQNQQFAANEEHLRRLVRLEAQVQGMTEFQPARYFAAGGMGAGGKTVSDTIKFIESATANLNATAAYYGALIESGNFQIAAYERDLASASPYEARQMMVEERLRRQMASGEMGVGAQFASREFGSLALTQYEERTLRELRKLNEKY